MKTLSFRAVLGLGLLFGLAAGWLGWDKMWTLAAVSVAACAWGVFAWQADEPAPEEPGAWQRRIDREYTLAIEGCQVTVFHLEQPCTRFVFKDPVEIQYLARRNAFPPLFWKIITPTGEF